jgi:cell shape-determining protein MreD
MAYCFNIWLLFLSFCFRHLLLPYFRFNYDFFNLMNLFVVYLVLYRPTQEIIIFVVLTGILMDSFSGCPFGLYMTIYIWLSIGIKWALKYLHKGNVIVNPHDHFGVILVENILIMVMMALIEKNFFFVPKDSDQ